MTDLARVSRYVFREMNRHGNECGTTLPLAEGFGYVVDVEVAEGRIASAHLAGVAAGGEALPVPEWPATLSRRIRCLEGHLTGISMSPVPSDGVYATRFSVAAAPGAAPRDHPRPAPAQVPDPAEAGIPDLARAARYVFREMQRAEGCSFANPLRENLEYELELGVRGRVVASVDLVGVKAAAFGGSIPLAEEKWPPALPAYVDCLRPRLLGLEMAPAPADGTYRVSYGSPAAAPSDPPS